ncbi:MAG: M1 family metallopeptidase [Acidobacteriota bacterium]|nr:M1 family metallopeptidase [Acidobacteriota bacterium]
MHSDPLSRLVLELRRGAHRVPAAALLLLTLFSACAGPGDDSSEAGIGDSTPAVVDSQSFARPDQVAVRELALDLDVDFDNRRLEGTASLHLDRRAPNAQELVLDTRQLEIRKVTLGDGQEVDFTLGEEVPLLGQSLTIPIQPDTEVVHVEYATSPDAIALQWLEPEQTAGGEHPFLFTQSQPTFARTWIPLQDTPQVRLTYKATVRVPAELLALMSASNPQQRSSDGIYRFEMPQAIPSYLIALAVGDLSFQSLGEHTGVYAEPPVLEAAAWEFDDTEAMLTRAEKLYGSYRWERFDILVLPPSFPFGGMENPRLTFATPTIIAGDRSLVTLVAHELAHSWSGNLVTNATWEDLWLNEGFTVYFERRIMEELEGRQYSEMLAELGYQDLQAALEEYGPESSKTQLHLKVGQEDDPDEVFSDIAYEKGYFFLRTIEETVGRERFDNFLRTYFDRYAFQPMASDQFVAYLRQALVSGDDSLEEALRIDEWVYEPGLPANVSEPAPDAFEGVDRQLAALAAGTAPGQIDRTGWTTHHWLHFLRNLPEDLTADDLARLDKALAFTQAGNAEIKNEWLQLAIAHDYAAAYPALESFLTSMGRIKFLAPLYRALAETEEGRARGLEIYQQARPLYHPLAVGAVDHILGWQQQDSATETPDEGTEAAEEAPPQEDAA